MHFVTSVSAYCKQPAGTLGQWRQYHCKCTSKCRPKCKWWRFPGIVASAVYPVNKTMSWTWMFS